MDRWSTSRYCTFVCGNIVSWTSKKWNAVAKSSYEAEFCLVAHGICEVMWIKRLLEELKFAIPSPIKVYCGNKAATAHNLVLRM